MKPAKPAAKAKASSRKLADKPAGTKSTPQSMAKAMFTAYTKRASIFRNGSNQAVRLPQDLRFADGVKEVRIRKQGDSLLISPVRPDWASFFANGPNVPEDFLKDRNDMPPQPRDPL